MDHACGHTNGRPSLKASPEQQQRLLNLQRIDSELGRVRHRAHSQSLDAQVQQLSDELVALQRDIVQAQTSGADLQRAVNKSEDELERVRKRLQRDRELVEQGASARAQRELEHELASLARRVSDLEDAELEMLAQQEQLAQKLTELQALEERVNERLVQSRAQQQGAATDSATRAQELVQERTEAIAGLDEALVRLYGSIRDQTPIAVAELTGNQCGGCRLELPPLEVAQLLGAAPEDVITCDECGCILVR